jgi:hypothetical protein
VIFIAFLVIRVSWFVDRQPLTAIDIRLGVNSGQQTSSRRLLAH